MPEKRTAGPPDGAPPARIRLTVLGDRDGLLLKV
jgi:hypothetical protein